MKYVPRKACHFCGQELRWPDPEYLRQLRESAGLTMRQMAALAGLAALEIQVHEVQQRVGAAQGWSTATVPPR